MIINCPVCDNPIELPEKPKEKERVTCNFCYTQLAIFKHKGEYILACAVCKDRVFEPGNCGECERRHERKRILEEGKL
ncbi:MAG: hypothetical protein WCV91_06215 [Candidatus Margulisiibacteriota bacterium]